MGEEKDEMILCSDPWKSPGMCASLRLEKRLTKTIFAHLRPEGRRQLAGHRQL